MTSSFRKMMSSLALKSTSMSLWTYDNFCLRGTETRHWNELGLPTLTQISLPIERAKS